MLVPPLLPVYHQCIISCIVGLWTVLLSVHQGQCTAQWPVGGPGSFPSRRASVRGTRDGDATRREHIQLRIRVIERLQTPSRFISYMTMMVQLDVGYVTQVRQVTGKSHVFTTVALLEFRPKPFGFSRL